MLRVPEYCISRVLGSLFSKVLSDLAETAVLASDESSHLLMYCKRIVSCISPLPAY